MLKQLMIQRKLKEKNTLLESLREEEKGLETREAELAESIEEIETDEEIKVVEEEVEELEAKKADLQEKKSKLQGEIEDLEGQLDELNSKEPVNKVEEEPKKREIEKGDEVRMNRLKFFQGRNKEEVTNLMEREDIKQFISRTRDAIEQKRDITGGDLTIPNVLLEMLRDNLHRYSKLVKHITLKPVAGKARQNILGSIPEAVWTEAVGTLNSLDLTFSQIEVDGYKVGGYIAVANSILEDSDENLVSEIMDALGQSIGYAVDKAILYGTGTKMPVGIITRLAETAEPSYWGSNEIDWTDLHTSNLQLIDATAATDEEFFKDLISKLGIVQANYTNGEKFWAMSSNTFATLQAKALTINAAGAIVSGQNKTMPIVGGPIEILDFIPDDVVVGGYGSLYLLAERAGAALAQSKEVQFIEDNTVFKGTARYDGRPVFGEAFTAINISQEDGEAAPVADDVTFATDSANA